MWSAAHLLCGTRGSSSLRLASVWTYSGVYRHSSDGGVNHRMEAVSLRIHLSAFVISSPVSINFSIMKLT